MIKNPLAIKLEGRKIVLASGSPRRKRFFEEMGIPFEIRLKPVEEVYPEHLIADEIPIYLAKLKASALEDDLGDKELLITSDTVVWNQGESLAKPGSVEEAMEMLRKLSGGWHKVITAVCFTTRAKQVVHFSTTEVKFDLLREAEMEFYIDDFQPFDKAGGYGIQEWLGTIAITEIRGSYNTVVGLPTHLVYKVLYNWSW